MCMCLCLCVCVCVCLFVCLLACLFACFHENPTRFGVWVWAAWFIRAGARQALESARSWTLKFMSRRPPQNPQKPQPQTFKIFSALRTNLEDDWQAPAEVAGSSRWSGALINETTGAEALVTPCVEGAQSTP